MSNKDDNDIIALAIAAKAYAQALYSNFRVGAALKTSEGRVSTGCNVEASSYSLTICAERVALGKALSEGETSFTTIAVATDTDSFCPPCGACRQLLMDYAPDLSVILINRSGQTREMTLKELLPEAFTKDFLEH